MEEMMSTPAGGERAVLHELEVEVREELTMAEGQPLVDGDGVPTAEWMNDPYAERYEVSVRTVLGAIEAVEDGFGSGSPPAASTPAR
jgi:hypothetical protein